MKYSSTMIVVKDIQKARHFYKEVLDLDVIADFGANITLTGGIGLQTLDTWKDFIRKQDEELVFKNNVCELFFKRMILKGLPQRYLKEMILNTSIPCWNTPGVSASCASTTWMGTLLKSAKD